MNRTRLTCDRDQDKREKPAIYFFLASNKYLIKFKMKAQNEVGCAASGKHLSFLVNAIDVEFTLTRSFFAIGSSFVCAIHLGKCNRRTVQKHECHSISFINWTFSLRIFFIFLISFCVAIIEIARQNSRHMSEQHENYVAMSALNAAGKKTNKIVKNGLTRLRSDGAMRQEFIVDAGDIAKKIERRKEKEPLLDAFDRMRKLQMNSNKKWWEKSTEIIVRYYVCLATTMDCVMPSNCK